MEVLAKVAGIASFVCFYVITNDDDPDISALGLEGLDDKREGVGRHTHLVVKIFNAGEDMHAKATIFPVIFEDYPLMSVLQVEGRDLEESLGIIDRQGVRRQICAEDSGLEDLGAACQLRGCRWNQADTPGKQVSQEVFFARLETKATYDDVVFFELLVGGKKCLVIMNNGRLIFQKIISENRW